MDQFWNSINVESWKGLAFALLIGLLVGAQRQGAHRDEEDTENRAGLRDFVLVSAIGGICGLLQVSVLTAAAFLGIAAIWVVFKLQRGQSAGLTTDLAAIAVFSLSYLAAMPGNSQGAPIALALTIVLGGFLEAKRSLHRFFRETITETEFDDTLLFLALIFVIYPLLPSGSFGPYEVFNPRRIWFFIILVSSISYVGYFLEKFLGTALGLKLAGILGGLASTTAATTTFAQNTRRQESLIRHYWQAATLANAIQFPRILALLALINPDFAWQTAVPLAVMSLAGLIQAALIRPGKMEGDKSQQRLSLSNPLSLRPALRFGAIFAGIILVVTLATKKFGTSALIWSSALGGLIDVDSVSLTVADMLKKEGLSSILATQALLLALFSNAVFKCGIAWVEGGRRFGKMMILSYLLMFGTGVLADWLF